MHFVRGLLLVAGTLVAGAGHLSAQQNEICFALDGSGSISGADFQLQLEGLAQAIENPGVVPHNGQTAVGVVQFAGNGAVIEVPRTVLTDTPTAQGVAAAIRAIVKLNGGTPMSAAIDTCVQALAAGSPNAKQVICIATDGVPNSPTATLNSRQNAINAGIDEIDALGVGGGVDPNFLNQLVHDGFVELVNSFAEFAQAVGNKLQTILGGGGCAGRNPGSVLIYPIHRSGPGLFTILCATNTKTDPITPISLGGSTGLHYEYVNVTPNPANPFEPLNCVVFDRHEFLTPADTLCVLTECSNAVVPNGQEGYVVVSAEDPGAFRTPWSHNYLIGSEIVISASGYVYAVNAIPVCSPQAEGAPTDLNANQKLDFDTMEYDALAEQVIIDSFIALNDSNLTLINLTGKSSDLNTVLFSVWNDNEVPLSATLTFSCWFDQPLTAISPLFTEGFLLSTPHDPTELDLDCDGIGDLETGWAVLDSIDVSAPDGTFVAVDGVVLGSITAGRTTAIEGGRLLWESATLQDNGLFLGRP